MTTLTLHQPWASAMFVPRLDCPARMLKGFETRGFKPSDRTLKPGARLAIHAGKTDNLELRTWWMLNVKHTDFAKAFAAVGINDWCDLPFGKVIGHGIFLGAYKSEALLADDSIDAIERCWGNYGPNRYGWKMQGMEKLLLAIPCCGRQSLFECEAVSSRLAPL